MQQRMLPSTKTAALRRSTAILCIVAVLLQCSHGVIQIIGNNFVGDSGCASDKTCFSDCDAVTGCNYEAACTADGTTATCTITGKVKTGNVWLAMAFSSDTVMGQDSVTGCKLINGQASIFNAENTGRSTPTDVADTGVVLTASETSNGILRCTFTREMAEGVGGKRFDLNQPWYWFVANGGLSGTGGMAYHGFTSRFISSSKLDLSGSSSTQAPVTGPFVSATGCGTTKTCYSDCASAAGCSYEVACTVSATDAECSITGKVETGDVYMAWGLSSDAVMGGDSVVGCKSVGGVISAFNSENARRSSTEYALEADLSLDSSSLANDIMRCTITRPLTPGQTSRLFDLSQPWHWIFATGKMNGGNLAYHSSRYPSTSTFDLSAAPATQSPVPVATQPPAATSGSIVKDSDCGSSKGCYARCACPTSCTFVVSWSKDSGGQTALYTIVSDVGSTSGSWIGLGFSADGSMGDDDIIGCFGQNDGTVRAFSAENKGKSPEVYNDNNTVLVSSSIEDGVLSCSIRRPVAAYTVDSHARRDLNQAWTLFVARGSGSLSNGAVDISYHGANNRFISGSALSVDDLTDEAATQEDFPMIKLHGALMIGAWVFLASIGIVAARYYKSVWVVDLCSQKVWFQIHRTCMVLVFCVCVAGFVVIFVEVEEWVEIEQKPSYLEGHPIMGVIVTGLCVLNPLMALIRPHPGTKNRPIFNWAHWFVGTSAHILGVVTIFFGFELDKADAPSYLKYIMAGYCAWQVLVELILEVITCCCTQKDHSEMYELGDGHAEAVKKQNKQPEQMTFAKKLIFVLHFFVVTSISAVLIGLLVKGKDDEGGC